MISIRSRLSRAIEGILGLVEISTKQEECQWKIAALPAKGGRKMSEFWRSKYTFLTRLLTRRNWRNLMALAKENIQ